MNVIRRNNVQVRGRGVQPMIFAHGFGCPTSSDEALIDETAEDLYEHAPCGYLSTLPDRTIVRVNQTFVDWAMRPREALLAGARFQALLTIGSKIYYETHYAPSLRMQGAANEIAFELLRGVADSGIGMAAEEVDRIFNEFTQGSPETAMRFGGSGLGLTITRRLLALYGTAVQVHSAPREGSTFSFDIRLPLPAPHTRPAS